MADTPAVSTIVKDLAYLKTHMALLAVVVVLAGGAVYGVETLISKHDVAQEAHDQQLLTLVTAQTNDLKTRMAQDEQQASVRDAQYSQIIAQLSGTINKQNLALQQQIKVNASLTAEQTAEAIASKIKADPGQVIAQGDGVNLTLPIARVINSDLDRLSIALFQLDETKQQFQAQLELTNDAKTDAENAKNIISSQSAQLSQADKFCKDEIATIKAQNRKSKMRWFGIGFISGLISAHFMGI